MLKAVQESKAAKSRGKFAIVASRYNARYVDGMMNAAARELKRAGAKVQIVRVPGAYEIPVVAAKLSTLAAKPIWYGKRWPIWQLAWIPISSIGCTDRLL